MNTLQSFELAIAGPAQPLPVLGFDLEWLKPMDEIIPPYFCSLHRALARMNAEEDKYKLMILLSTIAYSQYAEPNFVQTLLAFATVPEVRSIKAPNYSSFNLSKGYVPSQEELEGIFDRCTLPYEDSRESVSAASPGESPSRLSRFQTAKNMRVKVCIDHIMQQWPTESISLPVYEDLTAYVQLDTAVSEARLLFRDCFRNTLFGSYIKKLQAIINIASEHTSPAPYVIEAPKSIASPSRRHLSFSYLLQNPAPILSQGAVDLGKIKTLTCNVTPDQSIAVDPNGEKLAELLTHLSNRATGTYESTYIQDLQHSFEAFQQGLTTSDSITEGLDSIIMQHLESARGKVDEYYNKICDHLKRPTGPGHDLCQRANLCPRLSPSIILGRLSHCFSSTLDDNWKSAIVAYGLAISNLQRFERISSCFDRKAELSAEMMNPGHVDWDAMEYPDWLLLELENNILIRQEQAQIARQMISPSSGNNSIMQLNMGLGKSSVIVPIVSSALANGKKLSRVVVLKSLSSQMFQLLLNKLGGMINRRVLFMPISRSLKLDRAVADRIRSMYEDCKKSGGILLVQPEHLLSFELLGLDRLISGEPDCPEVDLAPSGKLNEIGLAMVNTQRE